MDSGSIAPPKERIDGWLLRIAGVVVLGVVMSTLDTTVVSIALPTFEQEFNTSYAVAAWTMTGYALALATVIPLTGWASDRFGTKRLYLHALVLFVSGSVLCSIAGNIAALIAFRILQGIGGGILMPLGMTILTRSAGPARLGRLMSILGIPMLLAPIAGPALSGWIIEFFSWHWIFLINLPMGLLALITANAVLPADAPRRTESFDFAGLMLLSPGVTVLLYGVSSIPEVGSVIAPRVMAPMLMGIALIAFFVRHAFVFPKPLIDLSLFKNLQLTTAVITLFLFTVAFYGGMLLIPSYFLQVRGESTLSVGTLMLPHGLGAIVTMPIAGRLADKTAAGRVILPGLLLIALGMGVLTQVGAGTSYPLLLGALATMGMGMGATMMPITTTALQSLTDRMVARGSTLLNIVQQVANSVGTAVMSVVLTNQLARSNPSETTIFPHEDESLATNAQPDTPSIWADQAGFAFAASFTVAFALILLACIAALFLPYRKRHVAPKERP